MCLCLASQNLSEREFFVPARMDLAVNLLTARGSRMGPLFKTSVVLVGHRFISS